MNLQSADGKYVVQSLWTRCFDLDHMLYPGSFQTAQIERLNSFMPYHLKSFHQKLCIQP